MVIQVPSSRGDVEEFVLVPDMLCILMRQVVDIVWCHLYWILTIGSSSLECAFWFTNPNPMTKFLSPSRNRYVGHIYWIVLLIELLEDNRSLRLGHL